MAANDLRGWVMSAVSGVGKSSSLKQGAGRLTLFHSMRPRVDRHLRRRADAAGHPPEELPDRQQQRLPLGVAMSQRRGHGQCSSRAPDMYHWV